MRRLAVTVLAALLVLAGWSAPAEAGDAVPWSAANGTASAHGTVRYSPLVIGHPYAVTATGTLTVPGSGAYFVRVLVFLDMTPRTHDSAVVSGPGSGPVQVTAPVWYAATSVTFFVCRQAATPVCGPGQSVTVWA